MIRRAHCRHESKAHSCSRKSFCPAKKREINAIYDSKYIFYRQFIQNPNWLAEQLTLWNITLKYFLEFLNFAQSGFDFFVLFVRFCFVLNDGSPTTKSKHLDIITSNVLISHSQLLYFFIVEFILCQEI